MTERQDKPRVGPWLRRYNQPKPSVRDRLVPIALGAVGWLVFAALVYVLARVFFRFPFHVLGGLVGVWGIGFALLTVKRRRVAARERQLREGGVLERPDQARD